MLTSLLGSAAAPAWSTPSSASASLLQPRTGAEREPALAALYVDRYSRQLGLDERTLKQRLAVMASEVLGFYRANPALFLIDARALLARGGLLPRPAPLLPVALDAHVGNFGTFRGADGRVVWGLNDFDQAGIGSPELDLLRLGTSVTLLAREANDDPSEQREVVRRAAAAYFDELELLVAAGMALPASICEPEASGPVKELIRETGTDDSMRRRMGELVKGDREPKLEGSGLAPVDLQTRAEVEEGLREYVARLPPGALPSPLRVEVKRRLGAGGSSFGLDRLVAMVQGPDPKAKPVLLELKQLLPSPFDSLTGALSKADPAKVIRFQQALGGFANPLTGEARISGRPFLVRELEPVKSSLGQAALNTSRELESVAEQAGRVLARAHAQTPERARALQAWVGGGAAAAGERLVELASLEEQQVRADFKACQRAFP